MSKSTMFFAASAAFLAGVAVGFLVSPVKGGVEFRECTMGSYNTTTGRWFSPKIAAVDNAKKLDGKKKSKQKKEAIPAEAQVVSNSEVSAEEKTGDE